MVSQERLSVAFENLVEAFRLSLWVVFGVALTVLGFYIFYILLGLAFWAVGSLALLVEEAMGRPGYITRGEAFVWYVALSVFVVFPLFMLIGYTLEQLERRGVSVAWAWDPFFLLVLCWGALFPLLFLGYLVPQPLPPLMDHLMELVSGGGSGGGGDLRPLFGVRRF